jgi:non-homologous end joining protein Ku
MTSKALDLTQYSDSYAKELRSIVEAKSKGKPLVTKQDYNPKDTPTDLLEALKASMHVKKFKK